MNQAANTRKSRKSSRISAADDRQAALTRELAYVRSPPAVATAARPSDQIVQALIIFRDKVNWKRYRNQGGPRGKISAPE